MQAALLVTVSVYGQVFFCILGIGINLAFLVVVLNVRKDGLGFYRWLMFAYACFEILYAATVLVGLPIHFVWEKTWIFFSYRGPLIGTKAAFLGSAMYCFFYEVWMGFVVINFIYRWIVVCRGSWVGFIQAHRSLQALFVLLFVSFIGFCALCTMYWCALNKITKTMEDKLVIDFGITNVRDIGYTMLRLFDISGNPSLSGIGATATHFVIVLISGIVIVFCSWNIWKEIRKMKQTKARNKLKLEKQLFVTLLLQTIIPVILCHIPSAINLTYPFWDHVAFEPITPFFAMFTTIPKAIDPIIALVCIGEYRRTFLRIIGFHVWSVTMKKSTVDCVTTQNEPSNTGPTGTAAPTATAVSE